MKLHLATRLEQQQILAPQMILSMDILLLNSLDLEHRIERELTENPALELAEIDPPEGPPEPAPEVDREVAEIFDLLDEYEHRYGGGDVAVHRSSCEENGKYEAMLNCADRAANLSDHVRGQLRFRDLDPVLQMICSDLAAELDHRGYLLGSLEETAAALSVPVEQAERAVREIQQLEPRGIGARDLRECLLLQLDSDPQALEYRVVEEHLDDLLHNRLPQIAQRLEVSLAEVKDARDLIGLLDPHPGAAYDDLRDGIAVPEIFVDEVDGGFVVRIDESVLPDLRISPSLSRMMREGGQDADVRDFIRKKLESARWLLHAIDQRHRTVADIAQCVVDRQESFFRNGPGHLNALTMQEVADAVGVHISTVSRAANGKYIETPFGVMELRRFFTGGVERAGGGIESRDNVCRLIREIVDDEDPRKPLSDSQLTAELQARGIEIARRTVSKYRERAGIAQARLRRQY